MIRRRIGSTIKDRQDLLILAIASSYLGVWLASIQISLTLFLFLVSTLAPASFLYYAQLHRHYHSRRTSAFAYHAIGIGYCALVGMSWVIYRKHHANHHRFNNGAGDWSRTNLESGQPRPGADYLFRCAVMPFAWQLLPYLSFLGMRPQNRTRLAFADETARVGLRLAVLLVGWFYLIALLAAQLLFIVMTLYLNYLQHYRCADSQARVWRSPLFNKLTSGLGLHDQHHAKPNVLESAFALSDSAAELEIPVSIFDPRTFISFLIGPISLDRRLSNGSKGVQR